MEPVTTLAEVNRILRPGGVLAVSHYVPPALTGIAELDLALKAADDTIYRIERERELKKDVRFFGKDGHTKSLEDSGHFRLVREVGLHSIETTTAERTVRGLETLGALQTLRRLGVTDEELGLTRLASILAKHLAEGRCLDTVLPYTLSLGVK